MTSPSTLSARDLRRAIATYGELLRSHREVINRLNVYPVPDGDTGTNMALTIESVSGALAELADDAPLGEVAEAIAHGSLMGARGNSGVILSQLLRGLVAHFPAEGDVTARELADALEHANVLARQAVVRPVEGTILSIARAGAEGANAHADSLVALVRGARDSATEALARTPDQLAVLKQAGVVDSGGAGLVLFFDALCFVVAKDELPTAPDADAIVVRVHEQPREDAALAELRYEVMYFLDADDTKMHAFREVWAGIGDSIVIVGGDGLYNCHIHTDDVGAAIEASLDAGRPREIRVTDLADQVIEERWVREATVASREDEREAPPTTAVVAVVVGEGIGRIFHSLGVRQLVLGGQSMNPSTADLVEAVRATGSSQVVLLPNNKNIQPVAEQVAGLVEQRVSVVPTNSIVEGFAALLAYDPDASAEQNASAMRASACNVVAGEVTQAVRDVTTDAGRVREGDWIGLGASGVLSVADSIAGASNQLLALLVRPEHELLTIIEGDGSSPANTRRVTEFLAEEYPRISVEVHHGGQPLYPYYFGLE
ncbi:MAG TPA: DAK2 domain-containing protein [Acidimicrobiales bacterium]|nr:DAK2 domain-containing protein [Acidimicrobiales bacterium]